MAARKTHERKPLIELIRKHVIEEGDCWNWTGALQPCGSVPTMNFRGKVGAVRRFILEDQGVELGKRLATYTCGNKHCVNPEHVAPITRRALQVRNARELGYASNPARRKKLSDNARKRAKITQEIADEIRAADGTQREKAERYGLGQATISRIMLNKCWIRYDNPFAGLFR